MSFMNGFLAGVVFMLMVIAVVCLLDTLFDAVKGFLKKDK